MTKLGDHKKSIPSGPPGEDKNPMPGPSVAPRRPGRPAKVLAPGETRSNRGANATIYFSDNAILEEVQKIVQQHPRGSMSHLVNQFIKQFAAAAKKQQEETPERLLNKFEFSTTIHL